MAKNDLLLLDTIIDEYVQKKLPSDKRDEVFEFFSTEQILKDYAFTNEQIQSGSVDGRNDGGIDQFFVLVGGHLAENIPMEYWPKSNAKLDVYLITCKHDDSFKQAPITTMIPSLIELLDFTIPSSALTVSYNEKVLKKRELLISTYKKLTTALESFNIHIIYACRGDETIESNIQSKAEQAERICQESFSDCIATFSFWGNSSLLKKYRENPNRTLELAFEQCINQNGQYVVLANLKKYYEFITDGNGKLNRHLFSSNVRDYLGLNPVNQDIAKTLKETTASNFWWLNNGITIIGSFANIIGGSIYIQNVQIVNGLQTSESIFNHFNEFDDCTEQRSVLVKILVVNDKETSDAIIYATNNQTNVNVSALRATDKLQLDIEMALKSRGIYYERRTNHYQNQGIPANVIITPLSLASGYISLCYKNPYIAASLKQKFMRDDVKYEQIFSPKVDLEAWFPIAFLLKKTDEILTEIKPEMSLNTTRFLKNYRQILLFITVSRLLGTFAFGEKQLITFDLSSYTKEEIQKSINDIKEVNPSCFNSSKKLPADFYTSCFSHIAEKYGIKAIQSIRAKNNELWAGEKMLSRYALSDEIVDRVFSAIPSQPWPPKMHKQIADALSLKDTIVTNAIGYLIYSGKLNDQVYGYVFDQEGNIIAEGEHYGHTENEAREKLGTQRAIRKRKYGFSDF